MRVQLNKSDRLFDGTLIAFGIAVGIILGIIVHVYFTPVVETAHAEIVVEEVEEPKEVLIEVVYTKEDIIRKIEETFPESPKLAVAIAKCESGLVVGVQSNHTLSYGREKSWSIMQIHEPAWDKKAMELGYVNYKTGVEHNLLMARYIYEQAGNSFRPWSCYSKGMI